MAQYHLFSILVHTPPSSSDFVANDVIDTYWDNSTSSIVVHKNSSVFAGTSGAYFGELDTNYYLARATSFEGDYAVSGYSYCSGADLKWFRMVLSYATYPYAEARTTTDSPVCATGGGAVCDITFSGAPTITHATTISEGGSITATATSSNGTVKYGLRNSEYSSMTNTTGTFTGLIPGSWTMYAKDANDCTAILNFKILYKPISSEEHYRFTWTSKKINQAPTRTHRVRIYEREYVGSVVEVEHANSMPFQVFKPKQGELNDKFVTVHPTHATLSLISERDYQFLPLYTQDHKRFRVVEEVDEGSGFAETWQGFIEPNIYQEEFAAAPYVVEIPITDGIKTLELEPFTDNDGNLLNGYMKLIKVLAFVLKKTGLNLKIRSGINIFEINHTQLATDDPLDQTYIDVACYRRDAEPFNCYQVLEAILKPFGARIVQNENQWLLEEIDRAYNNYAYRVFTADGDYESNSTTTNVVIDVKAPQETDRAALINRDHSLEVIQAYGKITVTTELNYVGSLIHGSFEKEDLLSPETEEMSNNPGIFTSEEGFRDWTLRLNGTSGVSFGRSVVLSDDNSLALRRLIDTEKATREDIARSVGTFYFSPGAWSGNLRDAYIESAPKPYQYGPGDEIKFSFDYSTPSTSGDIQFMILRMAIKVGNQWLQEDGTWDAIEGIYRAYPSPSTSLQTFEMFVPLPNVTVITDTTIQVRIYYYAKDFYDFGSPTPTDNRTDGTDGFADLRAFPTSNLDYDYKLDVRYHRTDNDVTNVSRSYAELRISDAAEDIGGGVLRPNDFNATTNPRIWVATGVVLENNKFLDGSGSARDTLFYIDNVSVDSIINGQDPPREEVRDITISKFIKGSLEVRLYNADRASVVNAKHMYNNYFRLSDGTPTTLWARSGIAEFLPLRDILLKVLAANHSAPTFRITGSFINEFARITPGNYIRIRKPGSSISLSNTTFTSDLSGWNQTGSGTAFTWVSGSAEVALTGSNDSQKLYQTISHSGGYINITVNLAISALSTGNTLEHILWAVFFKGSSIIHTEKLKNFPFITSLSELSFTHTAFVPSDITGIGFFFQYVTGSGNVTYQVTEFTPAGTDIQEVYQISDYQRMG